MQLVHEVVDFFGDFFYGAEAVHFLVFVFGFVMLYDRLGLGMIGRNPVVDCVLVGVVSAAFNMGAVAYSLFDGIVRNHD